jgi:hypothetical protein
MYICPTCDAETKKPSYENNKPFCPQGHRVFNESASKGLLNGFAWGVLLLGAATFGQNWIVAIPLAVIGVSLYKGWRLSQRSGPTRRLSKRFSSFGVGVLLPISLLIYPALEQVHAHLVMLLHH